MLDPFREKKTPESKQVIRPIFFHSSVGYPCTHYSSRFCIYTVSYSNLVQQYRIIEQRHHANSLFMGDKIQKNKISASPGKIKVLESHAAENIPAECFAYRDFPATPNIVSWQAAICIRGSTGNAIIDTFTAVPQGVLLIILLTFTCPRVIHYTIDRKDSTCTHKN